MTTTRTCVLTALCVALLASPAFAMSKNDCGPKPEPAEPSLQDILDDLVVSGPPIDASSPSPFELFVAGSTGITAQIILAADDLYFGIYDGDDPSNRAKLLKSGSPSSFIASVSFSDDGRITFPKLSGSGKGHGWHKHGKSWKHGGGKLDSRSGFDGPFGFFAKVQDGHDSVYIFTEDALNGGDERVLAFQGNGETVIKLPGMRAGVFRPDQFILAFDADGDGVFGDMIVAISGLDVPVPEPAAALLIGVSLLALVRLRRS
jgi:hypothetical protein